MNRYPPPLLPVLACCPRWWCLKGQQVGLLAGAALAVVARAAGNRPQLERSKHNLPCPQPNPSHVPADWGLLVKVKTAEKQHKACRVQGVEVSRDSKVTKCSCLSPFVAVSLARGLLTVPSARLVGWGVNAYYRPSIRRSLSVEMCVTLFR